MERTDLLNALIRAWREFRQGRRRQDKERPPSPMIGSLRLWCSAAGQVARNAHFNEVDGLVAQSR